MIHQVKLPPLTKQRLSEIVDLQMVLLFYAASESSQNLGVEQCTAYLQVNGFDATKQSRSPNIAQWIWRSKDRREPLIGFAAGPFEDKHKLVERLQRETQLLSAQESPGGVVNIVDIPRSTHRNQEKSWQEQGADFLRMFYNELSKAKLPGYLFSDPEAKDFSRKDFLVAFLAENNALYVCPICDESGSYTSSGGEIYTDIEHYFPQSKYPHFACHPYNLIPICHLCNSAIHGAKDPLLPDNSGSRLQLHDIILPYHKLSLGTVTRLNIMLDNASQSATFDSLVSTVSGKSYKTQIDSFDWMYEIPSRWNAHNDIDKVGETLFRRMRQFLRGSHELPIGVTPETVWPVLRYALYQLVYSLHTKGEYGYEGGDFGKDPYAFAMKWLLVTILNEERPLSGQDNQDKQDDQSEFHFPLLKELARWLGQDMNNKDEYITCAEILLKMLIDEDVVLHQNQVQLERNVE
jgi:hypothetical protein